MEDHHHLDRKENSISADLIDRTRKKVACCVFQTFAD